jgi:hypothetical protein
MSQLYSRHFLTWEALKLLVFNKLQARTLGFRIAVKGTFSEACLSKRASFRTFR